VSLSHVPTDRVVRIAGASDEQLAVGLDPLPRDAPAVIRYRVATAPVSPLAVVDDALDRLEVVARELFPAWLPDADVVTTSSDFDRRVVRDLARRMASTTEHYGPFVADVAEAALCGRPAMRRFDAETRARGLARIIGDAYRRDAVVLLVEDAALADTAQHCVAAACEWLAAHGAFGVWLGGQALPAVDRFPTWLLAVPTFVERLTPSDAAPLAPGIEYPAVAGRPHPASIAEQTLERCLAQCDWALGRVWNQVHAGHSLVPPIRVDLMWPRERCVVEIDGPDHRGVLKYADDRRRDNGLVLDGFAVLRFTNDEIDDDPARVVGTIERLLVEKRNGEGKPL
jgi:very-short-patch-repair endonuclease